MWVNWVFAFPVAVNTCGIQCVCNITITHIALPYENCDLTALYIIINNTNDEIITFSEKDKYHIYTCIQHCSDSPPTHTHMWQNTPPPPPTPPHTHTHTCTHTQTHTRTHMHACTHTHTHTHTHAHNTWRSGSNSSLSHTNPMFCCGVKTAWFFSTMCASLCWAILLLVLLLQNQTGPLEQHCMVPNFQRGQHSSSRHWHHLDPGKHRRRILIAWTRGSCFVLLKNKRNPFALCHILVYCSQSVHVFLCVCVSVGVGGVPVLVLLCY